MLFWQNINTGVTVVTPHGYDHSDMVYQYGSSGDEWALRYDLQVLETYHMDGIVTMQAVAVNGNDMDIMANYTVIDYSDNDTILYCVMHGNTCMGWSHNCIEYRKAILNHVIDTYINPCYIVIE